MSPARRFFLHHKTFFLSIGFLVAFATSVSYAVPPASPYMSGETLDPQCVPGATNCSVANDSVYLYDAAASSRKQALAYSALNTIDIGTALRILNPTGLNNNMSIVSNPALNSISTPSSDIILSVNDSQPNTITGTSNLRGIWGGYDNTIGANLASNIFGSHHSVISGDTSHAVVIGGSNLSITGNGYSVALAGTFSTTNGIYSAIIAGNHSTINDDDGAIISATNSTIQTGKFAFIGPSQNSMINMPSGQYAAIISGVNNSVTSSGYGFIGQGSGNTASNVRASILNGINGIASGVEATVLGGQDNTASGNRSIVINGIGNTAYSYGESVMGLYATTYTPISTTNSSMADKVFRIGIGSSDISRRDAVSVYKSGTVEFGSSFTESIASGAARVISLPVAFSFAPTSGVRTFNGMEILTTINQTGGANGITRGIYINPTLTAAADWRGVDIATNSGYAVYQSGANAQNYFAGAVGIGIASPTAKLHVLSTTEQLRLGYNTTNYWSSTVGSTGGLSLAGTGTGGALTITPTAGQNINFALSTTGDFAVNTTQLYVDTSAASVGIGTATPSTKLHIVATSATAGFSDATIENTGATGNEAGIAFRGGYTTTSNSSGRIYSKFDGGTSYANARTTIQSMLTGGVYDDTLTVRNARVGVANINPAVIFHAGSSAIVTGTTVGRFENAGGTCDIIPSTSGGISCSSDMNLKKNISLLSDNSAWSYNTNITVQNQSVLNRVLALVPVNYNWKNVEQDTDAKHAGFIAQEVQQVFPDLVSEDPETHKLSLNYAGMMPYTVQAIQEMNLTMKALPSFDDSTLAQNIATFLRGIAERGEAVVNKVTTKELCLNSTCLTEAELQNLIQLQQSMQQQSSSSSSSGNSIDAGTAQQGQTQTTEAAPLVVEPPVIISHDSDSAPSDANQNAQEIVQ